MAMASGEAYTPTTKLRDLTQAVLYRGRRNADRAPVLLKILDGERPSAAQVARLRHEYAILQSLSVPGVVRPLGLEKVGDSLALVLEDVGGQAIEDQFLSGGLDLTTFLKVAISMTLVVESIHRHHIIHKDIKPENFIFAPDGDNRVTLIDFAVATRLSLEDRRASSVNRLEGTLAYMSPEQTGRMNRVLDRRTDIYSLGVTFYRLLTGVLPFRSTDPLELVHSHIARTPAPPHAINPAVPPLLSAIVMRLLSKNAEDRYQDVGGLRVDLERCLERLDARGQIAPFPLGEEDFSDELRIPQKLYGREAEARELLATFERTQRGSAELLLISGYSGIGKSALVNEIPRQLLSGGRFISGKFDQLGRRIPYQPITRACAELMRSILAEPPEELGRWRRKILEALGPNARVVIDLVPELELVIGPQPDVQRLGPSETQHRFEQAFQSFLQVFTFAEHPLVLFLDDLQWADPASLRLVHLVLTSPRRGHLLVIGAYRENEVDPVHPLSLALVELRKAGATTSEIRLRPLGLSDVTALLTDTFGARRTESEVAPLAALVLRKTNGNPFFLNQFVTDLYKNGLLGRNAGTRRWAWALDRIENTAATDNVVDFLIAKLRRLGSGPQLVLSLAACIGHQFDRRTLALVSERSSSEVAALLWEALREGLIAPLDANQSYVHDGGAAAGDEWADDELNPSYRFLHDRVQQAAYALIDEAHKQEVHLRIGRLMLARAGGAEERLFDVVSHMNFGSALIADPSERLALAKMNLAAGRRARDAIAYSIAIKFLATCHDLLGREAWDGHAEIARDACLMQAECEFVCNNVDEAFRLLDLVTSHARSPLDRVAALKLRTLILSHVNRLEEAIATGLDAAHILGMEFPRPDTDLGPAIGAELGALGAALADRTIESLIDLPEASDPETVALLDVLYGIIPAAAQSNTPLMVLTVAKAVTRALQRGNSRVSSYFYICYGMVLAGGGDAETAYRLGQVGIRLNERMNVHAVSAANHFVFAAFISFWRRPLSESLQHFEQGLKAGLDSGDYFHAAYCITFLGLYRLYSGESIEEVEAELAGKAELLERTGNVVNRTAVKLVGRLIACFKGETARGSLQSEKVDIREMESAIVASGNRFLISTYYLYWAVARYSAGDFVGAIADLEKAVPAVPPELTRAEITLFAALARAGCLRTGTGGDRSALLEELRNDEKALAGWAAASPGTFGYRHALVAAELASVSGDGQRSVALYDQAAALARQNGSTLHEALANELCAAFANAQGWAKVGDAYLRDARAAYQRFGATGKTREIAVAGEAATDRADTAEVRGDQLDTLSLVKASQAISTEIVLARLIQSLMRIVIEQAGAERGHLLLLRDGELWVEGAAGTVDVEGFQRFRLSADGVDGRASLPRAVIDYVQRTREKVLLNDAAHNSTFAADPYFRAHQLRSLLCLPLVRQGELVGMLHLENSLAGDAFSPDRVEILEVLSSQAAVSLENAILYDEMERRVKDRTRELAESLDLLKRNQAQLIEAERRTAVAHYEREMAIAQQIQTSILPKRLDVPGLEIAASMVTASEVGGDYYDLWPTEDGGCWLGIGDVSGHGLDAGLMMLMIQSSLGTLMRRDPDAPPSNLVCLMNRMVHENIRTRLGRDDYATLSLYRFHPDGRFVLAGAHEEMVVWRARTGLCEHIGTSGIWVGVRLKAEAMMPNQEHRLESGDVLMLYTDGLTEARNDAKEQLGLQRMADTLKRLHDAPAADICGQLLEQAKSWAPVQDDDRTVIIVRRT